MLILSRRTGQGIRIGDAIRITGLSIDGQFVRLGIDAPAASTILREELWHAIAADNRAAATTESTLKFSLLRREGDRLRPATQREHRMSRSFGARVRRGIMGLLVLLCIVVPLSSTAAPAQPSGADWPMYHANPARTGSIAGMPNPTGLTTLWRTPLDGAVYAEPLVVNGQVLVATEHDSLYALDARTGRVRWHLSAGTPVPQAALPCGDIFPLGITGTPVYDPRTGLIFAVAEISGAAGPAHILIGVDVRTGRLLVRQPVDPPGIDRRAYQQRGALAIEGDRVYVPFGGLDGDCSDYRGLLVAARTGGTGTLLHYQVPTPREGGIWETPGPAIDAQGNLYVSVGNGAVTQGSWDHSDSILRFSPTLHLEDGFAPASWQTDNAHDADLGSMGPVLLPQGLLYADGKSGQGYLMHAAHLGGIGGQIQTLSVCAAFGGAAVQGRALVIPCVDGLRQLLLAAGPRVVRGWQAPAAVTGSPVIGGQTVYSLDPAGGVLYALNAATGAVRTTINVGSTSRFATPALSGRSIFVGTLRGVVAVEVNSSGPSMGNLR
jgi:carbon storage regulator CsrA